MAYRVTPNPSGGPPTVTFDTPRDFVDYVDRLPDDQRDPGSVRQADEIRRNPSGYVMSGGHPRKKDDYLGRNLPWIGPAVVGALAAGPVIGAIKGASSMTGLGASVGPSSAGGGAWAIPPVAATGGNMAGLGWLDAAMLGGDLFGKIFGATKASNATDRAAAIQAEAAREALAEARRQYDIEQAYRTSRDAVEQGRYDTRRGDLAPYRATGQASITRMGDLLANSAPPRMPASVQARIGPASSMRQVGAGRTPAAAGVSPMGQPVSTTMPVGRGGLVLIEAPTGERREVPQDQAAAFIARGARRVA